MHISAGKESICFKRRPVLPSCVGKASCTSGPAGNRLLFLLCSLWLHQWDALNKYEAENPTGALTRRGLPGINFSTDNIAFFILFLLEEAKFHSFWLGASPALMEPQADLTKHVGGQQFGPLTSLFPYRMILVCALYLLRVLFTAWMQESWNAPSTKSWKNISSCLPTELTF